MPARISLIKSPLKFAVVSTAPPPMIEASGSNVLIISSACTRKISLHRAPPVSASPLQSLDQACQGQPQRYDKAEYLLHGQPTKGRLQSTGYRWQVGHRPGETRLELLKRNASVFETVIPKIIKYAPETILLIASNPVDVITQMSSAIAGIAPQRVRFRHDSGYGTYSDAARRKLRRFAELGPRLCARRTRDSEVLL